MITAIKNLLEKHPRAEWLIPAALCLILLTQLLLGVQHMSQHADESTHLYAGYRVLECGDYAFGREHPPLAKMFAAIPLVAGNVPLQCKHSEVGVEEADEAIIWLYSQQDWWSLLRQARFVASLFSVALCLAVWITARRFFGLATAVLSTAILAFEPNILGFGALVLNDILLTALFLFTVYSFFLWTRHRSFPFVLLTGVLTGMALLTKYSAILLIPTLVILAAVEAWLLKDDIKDFRRKATRNLGVVVAILAIAAATIWCAFGMHFAGETRRASNSAPAEEVAKMNSADMRILKAMRSAHLMPQSYLDGLIEVRGLVTGPLDGYILGRYHAEAPWYFFPLTTAIKFTVPCLIILVLGFAGILSVTKERRKEVIFLLVPGLLYLATSMQVRIITGFKHILPTVPFLLIIAAAGCVHLSRRYRWLPATLAFLIVLHAASSLRAYPNYLSYANELWGGPQNLYQLLPWTDAGQTFQEVSRYMKQHPNTPCWINSGFFMRTAPYDIPCTQMGRNMFWRDEIPERMKGIVFISASALQLESEPGDALEAFNGLKPTARLGGSAMLVYEGDFDTHTAAARALDNAVYFLLSNGDRSQALRLSKKATQVNPSSANAHDFYCTALALNGYLQEGLLECSTAKRLAQADPRNKEQVKNIADRIKFIAETYHLPLPDAQ